MLAALFPLVLALAPTAARILGKIVGNAIDGKAGQAVAADVVDQVTAAATRVFGTSDPREAAAAAATQPEKASEFAREMDALALKYAEIDLRDRERASNFQRKTGTAPMLLTWGMRLVAFTMLLLFLVIVSSLLLLAGVVRVPYESAGMATGIFGLVGTVVGFFTSQAAQIVSFYWGSSSSSADKTGTIADAMRDMGVSLGEAASARPPVPALPPPSVVVVPQPSEPAPAKPHVPLDWKQGPFGGVRWALTPDGVLVEGNSAPERTVGTPATMRRIWQDYGPLLAAACAKHGVPLELAVACMATESKGIPSARLVEPDGRQSIGLMQTLVSTASEVLGRTINPAELYDPATSIEAGVGYIAKQRRLTGYDPVFVAAAYNSGGIHPPRAEDNNPWKLRSTGDHISRFCQFFGDACFVAKVDGWSH